MVSELSILIPVYNYNITHLVKTLHQQCQELLINFEIRLYDDGSRAYIRNQNTTGLQNLSHTNYTILPIHLGRSAIRNKLAQDALYAYLLFLDNDSEIVQLNFISNYLQVAKTEDILIGGTIYSQVVPPLAYKLHWQYGRNREQKTATQRNKFPYQSFQLNNIFIPKSIALQHPLKELPNAYGHEDTLLGLTLKEAGVKVRHIDNPVLHIGLETTEVYLQKTKQAAFNLYYLYRQNKINKVNKLIRIYQLLKNTKLLSLYLFFFKRMEKAILKQLQSTKPSLLLLDLYKLYNFASGENSFENKL